MRHLHIIHAKIPLIQPSHSHQIQIWGTEDFDIVISLMIADKVVPGHRIPWFPRLIFSEIEWPERKT